MIRLVSIVVLMSAALPAFAEHPNCVVRDDPQKTCTEGTAWDASIGGCMPVVTG